MVLRHFFYKIKIYAMNINLLQIFIKLIKTKHRRVDIGT